MRKVQKCLAQVETESCAMTAFGRKQTSGYRLKTKMGQSAQTAS
jgi:hypothetical protein